MSQHMTQFLQESLSASWEKSLVWLPSALLSFGAVQLFDTDDDGRGSGR